MQTYLNILHKRNKIILEDKNLMQPKITQIVRAHVLPKIHKDYQDVPICPIVDITSTLHYDIAKFLSSLLNPLAINNYSVNDSFESANHIQAILPELLIKCSNSLALMSPHCFLMFR